MAQVGINCVCVYAHLFIFPIPAIYFCLYFFSFFLNFHITLTRERERVRVDETKRMREKIDEKFSALSLFKFFFLLLFSFFFFHPRCEIYFFLRRFSESKERCSNCHLFPFLLFIFATRDVWI